LLLQLSNSAHAQLGLVNIRSALGVTRELSVYTRISLAQNTQRHSSRCSQWHVHGDKMVSTMTAAPGVWDEGFTAAIGRPIVTDLSICVTNSIEHCKGVVWLLDYRDRRLFVCGELPARIRTAQHSKSLNSIQLYSSSSYRPCRQQTCGGGRLLCKEGPCVTPHAALSIDE
jgi:hypothetical protein